jgi:hypothetical protein
MAVDASESIGPRSEAKRDRPVGRRAALAHSEVRREAASPAFRERRFRGSIDLRPLAIAPADEPQSLPIKEIDVSLVPVPESAGSAARRRGGYLRKSDLLRAQLLPEIEVLDFAGLFIGNCGRAFVEAHRQHRRAVSPDPARIADLLLQGNAYRRNGEHTRALICYQELAELDPGNTDFRFLLEVVSEALSGSAPA